MADIAAVFHWAPETMAPMEIEELMEWHDRAVTRFKMINSQR